jgi:hypothetical protein
MSRHPGFGASHRGASALDRHSDGGYWSDAEGADGRFGGLPDFDPVWGTRVRPGAPIVEKLRRKVTVLARGFEIRGNVHVHAHGQIAQFLEATDPRFLPITELTVRRLSGSGPPARFSAAMVNREQFVTFLEASELPESDLERQEVRSA